MDFLNSDTVQHLIGHYGYGAIFVIVMLESAGIPMPGETILVTAAVYAGTKHALDIRWVIAAAAGGAILGDNIGFWVGREFGEPLLEKWGHLVGLDARNAADFLDRKKWTPGRRARFSAGWGTLLTNDFRGCDPAGASGFDPVSLICKVTEVDGRPAVKLSDNYSKALGPPSEIERYRRVFGTAGVSNTPVIA